MIFESSHHNHKNHKVCPWSGMEAGYCFGSETKPQNINKLIIFTVIYKKCILLPLWYPTSTDQLLKLNFPSLYPKHKVQVDCIHTYVLRSYLCSSLFCCFQGWLPGQGRFDKVPSDAICLGLQWKMSPTPMLPTGHYWESQKCSRMGGYVCKMQKQFFREHPPKNESVTGTEGRLTSLGECLFFM